MCAGTQRAPASAGVNGRYTTSGVTYVSLHVGCASAGAGDGAGDGARYGAVACGVRVVRDISSDAPRSTPRARHQQAACGRGTAYGTYRTRGPRALCAGRFPVELRRVPRADAAPLGGALERDYRAPCVLACDDGAAVRETHPYMDEEGARGSGHGVDDTARPGRRDASVSASLHSTGQSPAPAPAALRL